MGESCVALALFLVVLVAMAGLGVFGAVFDRIRRLEQRIAVLEAEGAARTAPEPLPAATVPPLPESAADTVVRPALPAPSAVPTVVESAIPTAELPLPTATARPDTAPTAVPESVPVADSAPTAELPRPEPLRPPPPAFELPSVERLVVWLGAAIGGFALLLAALFALVAIIEKGWIGPSARITAGFVGGMALWVGGTVARRWWPVVGSALAGAGIGTLYGAAYAASGVYGLVPPGLASAIMMAVTVVATVRSAVDRDRFVAWLALIGGLLTPWLVSTGENHPYALFLYLTLLATGVAAAARWRSWPDLLLGAAVGAAALHAGWASSWYTASQVPAALFGALVLTLPFAAAAGARGLPVRVVGALVAALLPLVALPWVVPVGSSFYDPRSGMTTVRAEPLASLLAALAPAILALPGALAARRHHHALQAAVALVPVGWLGLVGALGVLAVGPEPSPWTVVGAVLPSAVLALLSLREPGSSRGFALALPIGGVVLALLSTQSTPGAVAGGILALAVVGAVLSSSSRDGWTVAAAVAGVALPAWAAGASSDPLMLRFVAGPAVVALVLLVQGPIRVEWLRGRDAGWSFAALAAVALFPPLYATWMERFGDAAIGLLPLLLSGYVLLAALALARRRQLSAESLVLAVFTIVVLAGITTAVPLQLRARWITVGWAIEAAALARLAPRVRHPVTRLVVVLLVAAVAVRLLLNPFALSWGTADEGWIVLNWTLYTWGVPLVCVLLVARWLPGADRWLEPLRLPLWVLAALIGFALVNVEVSHAFQPHGPLDLWGEDRLQSMVRSATWAAYGLLVLGIGLGFDQRVVRLVGFAFVLLATFKVFGYDLWDLRGFVRVGSIGCLGVSLLLAALAFERLVLRSTRKAPDVEVP